MCNLQFLLALVAVPRTKRRWTSAPARCGRFGGANGGINSFILPGTDIEDVAPTLAGIQATVTVMQSSLNFKCSVLFQVSADGVTWDTAVIFTAATYQAGNGTLSYAWNTATTNYKRKIRFLVNAEQASGTTIEMADVKVVIGMNIK